MLPAAADGKGRGEPRVLVVGVVAVQDGPAAEVGERDRDPDALAATQVHHVAPGAERLGPAVAVEDLERPGVQVEGVIGGVLVDELPDLGVAAPRPCLDVRVVVVEAAAVDRVLARVRDAEHDASARCATRFSACDREAGSSPTSGAKVDERDDGDLAWHPAEARSSRSRLVL